MGGLTNNLDPGSMGLDDAAQSASNGAASVMQQGLAKAPSPVQQPTDAPKRHGGLLTGLVGVLLDGLSAGVQTAPGPSGPSQAAATAAQMPAQRQQKAINFQSQQMMQKAQLAQAHIQEMQTRLLASSLDDEIASGLSDAAWKSATKSVEEGNAEIVGGTGTREAIADKWRELHDQAPDGEKGNLFIYPAGKSKDGSSEWAVYKSFPNKTSKTDEKFHLDGTEEMGGKIPDLDYTFPAGMTEAAKTSLRAQLTRDHITKVHAEGMENKAKKDPTGEEAAYQQELQKNPKLTRLAFHQQWEKASAKPANTDTTDYRLLSAQDREQKAIQPIIDKDAQKIGDLNEADKMLDSKDSMGDAFAPVKALVGVAGGQGTGVRITTPELNRILQARGVTESAEVFLKHAWNGASLSDDQRTKLHGILDDVRTVVRKKADIYKQYSSEVNNADNPNGIREARRNFIKSLDDYEKQPEKKTPQGPPAGAKGKAKGSDDKMHWTDGTKDLGVVND